MDDVLYLDERQRLFLHGRITLSSVDIIDLLPSLKDGVTTTITLNNLETLDKNLSLDKSFCYSRSLFSNRRTITDDKLIHKLEIDESIIFSLCEIFHYYPELSATERTIYQLITIIFSDLQNSKFLQKHYDGILAIMGIVLSHVKTDPLLISMIMKSRKLVRKYLRDRRSNKFSTLSYFQRLGNIGITSKGKILLEIIMEEIVTKVLLSKEIIGNLDIVKYMLSLKAI